MNTRTQLSLYVPEPFCLELEAVRRLVDPVQSGLIPAHVTLCREDEIAAVGLSKLKARLSRVVAASVTLSFGSPERFQGHGLLLPCIDGETNFQALRVNVLGPIAIARHQSPHITLAHPRNPRSPHNNLDNTISISSGIAITFRVIRLIEQLGNGPWQVLEEYSL